VSHVDAIITFMASLFMGVTGKGSFVSSKMEDIFEMSVRPITVVGSILLLEQLASGNSSACAQDWVWTSPRVSSPGSLLLPPDKVGRAALVLRSGISGLRVWLDLLGKVLLSASPYPGRLADELGADAEPGELVSLAVGNRRFLGGDSIPEAYEASGRDGVELSDILEVILSLENLN
jgi:hypothetical protein